MPDYRLYSLDGAKSVMRTEDFDALSDSDAIRIARAMQKRVNCELWSLDRLVATIPARGDASDAREARRAREALKGPSPHGDRTRGD
jgi:hypothetical protein